MAKSKRRLRGWLASLLKSDSCGRRPARQRRHKLACEWLEPRHLLATLSGTLSYELPASAYVGGAVAALPISGAEVQIVGTMVGTGAPVFTSKPTFTQADGAYTATLPALSGSLTFHDVNIELDVYATTGVGPNPAYAVYSAFIMPGQLVSGSSTAAELAIETPANGSGPTITATSLGLVNGLSRATLKAIFAPAANGTTTTASSASALEEFNIFEALCYGYSYYKSLDPAGDSAGVKVYYDPTFTGQNGPGDNNAYYTPQTSYGAVGDIVIGSIDQNLTWQIVLHEYGHHIADINGFYAPVGGTHGFSYSLRTEPIGTAPGAANPPLEKGEQYLTQSDQELAWNEGFADYFSIESVYSDEDNAALVAAMGPTDPAHALLSVGGTVFDDEVDLAQPLDQQFVAAGAQGAAAGEDTEASVASILFQLANAEGTTLFGGSQWVFAIIAGWRTESLSEFFEDALPVNTHAWRQYCSIFEVNGVTPVIPGGLPPVVPGVQSPAAGLSVAVQPVQAVAFNADGIPTFTFQIPAAVTSNGNQQGIGDDASNTFQILFFNSAGQQIFETDTFYAGVAGYQVVPEQVNGYLGLQLPGYTLDYGQYTISAGGWSTVTSAATGGVVWWTVAASYTGPFLYYLSPPPPSFFPPPQKITVPAVLALADSGSAGSVNTLIATVSGATGPVAKVNFYEASASGPVLLGSVGTPSGGQYTFTTSIPYYPAGNSSGALTGSETFWAVAVDVNGSPVSNWAYAADGTMQFYWMYSAGYSTDGSTLTSATTESGGPYYAPGQYVTIGVGPLTFYNNYTGATASVSFYSDPDGNPLDATLIATDTTANAAGNYLVTFSTSQYDPASVYAVLNVVGGGQSAPWGYGGPATLWWYLTPDSPPLLGGLMAVSGENEDGTYTSGTPLTLSVAAATADGNNPTVEFYAEAGGTGQYVPGDATLLGPGTLAGGLWSLSGIDTDLFTGPQTFFAVVTDDLGEQSVASLTMNSSAAPVIADLTSSADSCSVGDQITLAASGITIGDGNPPAVMFYQETDGTENLDTAKPLGTGIDLGDGYALTFAVAGPVGTETYFAVATDDQGQASDPSETLTITIDPASSVSIEDITAAPLTVEDGIVSQLTLSADVIGSAESVEFYQAAGANAAFSSATEIGGTPTQNSDGSWSLPVDVASLNSPVTYFAVATDQSDIATDPTSISVNPISIGSFSGAANTDGSVTLSASGIMDWSAAATGATFYLDTQGTGVLDTVDDPSFTATYSDGAWTATVPQSDITVTGPLTFFAVASDGTNTSAAAATTVAGPWLDGLAATPTGWDDTGMVTYFSLSATADPYSSDAIASVTFYQDNGSGVFSPSDTVLATVDSSVDGLWTAPSLTAPTSGPQTFWAVASDADGLTSSPIQLDTGSISIASGSATMNAYSLDDAPSASLTASNLLDWGNAERITLPGGRRAAANRHGLALGCAA